MRRPDQVPKSAVFALEQNVVRLIAFAVQVVDCTDRVDLLTVVAFDYVS